jgi:MerR family transcriptional regulator/heat shock protein HspR
MPERRRDDYITIRVAASRTHLSPRTVRRYIRRGLVEDSLTEDDLAKLRRIRRLTDLGVNLAGVEVVLHMRGRIEELQAEIRRLEMLIVAEDR